MQTHFDSGLDATLLLDIFKTISRLCLPLLPNDSVNREMQSMREKFNFQITREQKEPRIEFLSAEIKSICFIGIRQACTVEEQELIIIGPSPQQIKQ